MTLWNVIFGRYSISAVDLLNCNEWEIASKTIFSYFFHYFFSSIVHPCFRISWKSAFPSRGLVSWGQTALGISLSVSHRLCTLLLILLPCWWHYHENEEGIRDSQRVKWQFCGLKQWEERRKRRGVEKDSN